MWSCAVIIVACAVLAAANVAMSTSHDIGDKVAFNVNALPHRDFTCHLQTPIKSTINFSPDGEWDKTKYHYTDNFLGCSVVVTITDISDTGLWRIFYKAENETTGYEKYEVYVNSEDSGNAPKTKAVSIGDAVVFGFASPSLQCDDCTCHLGTPSASTIELHPDDSDEEKYQLLTDSDKNCAVKVNLFDAEDLGQWRLLLKNGTEIVQEQIYILILKAPALGTPENRIIDNLPAKNFDVSLGDTLDLKIDQLHFSEIESCHLITNDGKEYKMPGLPKSPSLKWIEPPPSVSCQIRIPVDEKASGAWMLFSREKRLGYYYERRKSFNVSIEEIVAASVDKATIMEGNDLYLRLANAIGELRATCELIVPDGAPNVEYETDIFHRNDCGYIIKGVSKEHSGRWFIKYGTSVTYIAPIDVRVIERDGHASAIESYYEWIRGQKVDMTVGPENSTYCEVSDPSNRVVFEGFSRCVISLEQVLDIHKGIWTMRVGVRGKILTEEHRFHVTLISGEDKTTVVTSVEQQTSNVFLSCALPTTEEAIRGCKFKNPFGKLLIATQAVGEDRYSFNGINNTILESNVSSSSCGIRVSKATWQDHGIWRCAVEMASKTYYGFLNVDLSSMSNNSYGLSPAEPKLSAARRHGVTPGPATLLCTIESPIAFCFFRTPNGTVYNAQPGVKSDDFGYYGAGLEAGECGIQFDSRSESDNGFYTCHVGRWTDKQLAQHSASTFFWVYYMYNVHHITVPHGPDEIQFTLTSETLEYCRFVRSDGYWLTTNSTSNYLPDHQVMFRQNTCSLLIWRPTRVDRRPWNVAAKANGRSEEIYATTSGVPQPPVPSQTVYGVGWYIFMLTIYPLVIFAVFAVVLRIDKKKKFSSKLMYRLSLRKRPLPQDAPRTDVTYRENQHF